MTDDHSTTVVHSPVSASSKVITNSPERIANIDIPIISPREHVSEEIELEMVRVKQPVQIRFMNIRLADNRGYIVNMSGGKVSYFGACQEIHVDSMEELVQMVASLLGQTTYEFVEMPKHELDEIRSHTNGAGSGVTDSFSL